MYVSGYINIIITYINKEYISEQIKPIVNYLLVFNI